MFYCSLESEVHEFAAFCSTTIKGNLFRWHETHEAKFDTKSSRDISAKNTLKFRWTSFLAAHGGAILYLPACCWRQDISWPDYVQWEFKQHLRWNRYLFVSCQQSLCRGQCFFLTKWLKHNSVGAQGLKHICFKGNPIPEKKCYLHYSHNNLGTTHPFSSLLIHSSSEASKGMFFFNMYSVW